MSENQKNYYAIIPANVRYDKDLTANAKLLYGEITALTNEKGYCWATNGYFSELYGTTQETISRWIKQLCDKGYIKKTLIYKEGTKEIQGRYLYLCGEPPLKNKGTPPRKKVKGNTTDINNTINNTYKEIESSFENAFKEVIPNGVPIIDYAICRKRMKVVLSKISKEQILEAIDNAKKDTWIIDNGFSLMTILGDYQLNKLLNGKESYSKPLDIKKEYVPKFCCGEEVSRYKNFCMICGKEYNGSEKDA
jgi:hypothetical protein